MIQGNPSTPRAIGTKALNIAMPVVVFAAGIAVFAILMANKTAPAEADQEKGNPEVSVWVAKEYEGNMEVAVNGLVVPYQEITIAAQVEGIVAEKMDSCQAGKWVQAGTELLRIDSENYDIEILRLEAEVAQAVAAIAELEAETATTSNKLNLAKEVLRIREAEYKRYEDLSPDSGAVSASSKDIAEYNMLQAQIEKQSLEDTLTLQGAKKDRLDSAEKLARAQLRRAELDLERCLIKAPSDGVIVIERVEQEGYVMRGNPIVLFEDTSKAEVECNLRIEEMQVVLQNSSSERAAYELPAYDVIIEYELTNGDTIQWDGKLARINGIGVDETTRTVPCLIEVDQPVNEESTGIRALTRGMYVTARIQIKPITTLVRLPAESLQGKDTVWVVAQETRDDKTVSVLRQVTVEIADVPLTEDESENESDNWVIVHQIDDLLEPGTDIVTSPVTYETQRQEVTVKRKEDSVRSGGAQ